MASRLTPSQTVGPFFHKALLHDGGGDLAASGTSGERIVIEGRILDGDGAPVSDAMVEIWQANAAGRYDHPDDPDAKAADPQFHGFGRVGTDAAGALPLPHDQARSVREHGYFIQAPHINLIIFARGLLRHLATRIYFPDEPLNETDPVLCATPPNRRATPERRYRVEIILQGPRETVFFDF